MTSRYTENLLDKGMAYWSQGESVPIDLFTEMISAGLDVEVLEQQLKQEPK